MDILSPQPSPGTPTNSPAAPNGAGPFGVGTNPPAGSVDPATAAAPGGVAGGSPAPVTPVGSAAPAAAGAPGGIAGGTPGAVPPPAGGAGTPTKPPSGGKPVTPHKQPTWGRYLIITMVAIGAASLGLIGFLSLKGQSSNVKTDASGQPLDNASQFAGTTIPLGDLPQGSLSVDASKELTVNGLLRVNNAFVITPGSQPTNPVAGQLYLNQQNGLVYYYDGTSFKNFLNGSSDVTSLVKVGNGLNVQSGQIVNGGVVSLATTGNALTVTHDASGKYVINAGSGFTSINGLTGSLTLQGVANRTSLNVSGSTLTFSLPQDINTTSAVTFGSLTLDTLRTNGTQLNIGNSGGTNSISFFDRGNEYVFPTNVTGTSPFEICTVGNSCQAAGNYLTVGPNSAVQDPSSNPSIYINKTGTGNILQLQDHGTDLLTMMDTGKVILNGDLAVDTSTLIVDKTNHRVGIGTLLPTTQLDVTGSGQFSAGLTVKGANGLTLGSSGGANGGVVFKNSTNANTVTLTSGVSGSTNPVFALPTADGTSGQCIKTDGAGNLGFGSCPSGTVVNSLNGLNGVLTLNNASGSGSTVTIDNASTTTKGIASFNSTNFTAASGAINLVQNINATATPIFSAVNLGAPTAITGKVSLANATNGNFVNIQSGVTGTNGLTFTLPTADGTNGQCIKTDGSGALAFGACLSGGGGGSGGVTSLDSLSGVLTLNNSTGSGSAITIDNASTTQKGIASFNSTNFSGTGTINTVQDIATTSSPSFAALTASGANGLTVGTASSVNGKVVFQNSTNANTLTLQSGTTGGNLSFTLPTSDGTSAQCLKTNGSGVLSFGACLSGGGGGSGGVTSLDSLSGVLTLNNSTGSGSAITIDNASTTQKGIASFNSTNFTTSAGAVNLVQDIATGSSPTFAALNLGNATTATGQIGLANATNSNILTLKAGVTSSNLSFTLPTSDGTSGQCIKTDGSANLGFGACSAGTSVTSLNSLNGALTLSNASGSGSTITIDNATTAAKGIASFNSTNFSVASGAVNTIQGIATTATPSFAGLNATGSGGVTLGTASTNNGKLVFQNNFNSNTVTLQSGNAGSSLTFTLPTADGTNAQCLRTNGSGTLAFGDCVTPGGGGNVNSVDNLTGALTLSNSTGSGTTITIDNATTSGSKGIASFNSSDFTASGGLVDTIQGISTSSSPSFTGLTLSGQINCPVLITNGSGVISCGSAGSGVTSLNSLSGALTLANASGSGSTVTIDNATTAAKGIASFNSTNFSVSAGAVNTIQDIATTSTPSFTGLNVTGAGGAVLGVAGTTAGALKIANSVNSHLVVLQAGTIAGVSDLTFTLPTSDGTANQCIKTNGSGALSFGNCVAASGGVTSLDTLSGALTLANSSGSGSTVTIDNATTSGSKGIASFNSTNFTASAGAVNTVQDIATASSPQFANQTLGNAGVATGQLKLANGTNSNVLNLQAGATSSNGLTFTLPTADGTIGQCVKTDGSGNLGFVSCYSGTAVSSLNGLTGALSLANATGSGSTVTINDASTSVKGIAQFNSTNFTGTGTINLIQDIATSSSPSFTGLSVTGASGATLGTASTTNGALKFANSTNAFKVILNAAAPGASDVTFTLPGSDGTNTQCLKTNGSGALSFGNCVATAGVTSLDSLTGGLTISNTTGSGSTITIDNASTAAKGIASFNSTNFTASAGAVNTIQDIATTSTPSFTGLNVTGAGGATIGVAGTQTGPLKLANSVNTNLLTLQAGTTASNLTLTLPTADGTSGQCIKTDAAGHLSFGNCLSGSGSGGGVTSLNTLTGDITLNNASVSGQNLIINDASTSQKGIAQFNSTNFSVTGGVVNTAQGISTAAAPSFAGLDINNGGGTPTHGLFVDSTSLDVGINTNAPVAQLQINGLAATTGTGTISSSGTTVTCTCTNFPSAIHAGDTITASGQSRIVSNVNTSSTLTTVTAFSPVISGGTSYTFNQPLQKMVDSSSNLQWLFSALGTAGLGTVGSSSTKLTVKGTTTTSVAAGLDVQDSSGNSKLYVRNDGNVGIGSNSPSNRLVIVGATADSSAAALDVQSSTNGSLLFVRNDGNVGIGTSSPGSFKLQVDGHIGPNVNDTYDLGSSSLRFRKIYADNVDISGGTTTTLTQGSVVFAGASGVLSQDNSNFFFDATNHRLGIGTGASSVANTLLVGGTSLFSSTSTTALKIQDTSGSPKLLFTADTSNLLIKVGNGSPTLTSSTTGALFVTDTIEALNGVKLNGGTIASTSGQLRYSGAAQNTKTVQLIAEYAGTTLTTCNTAGWSLACGGSDSNIGTMTSGYDGTNKHNYYQWTSSQSNSQTYDVVVRTAVPSDSAALTGNLTIAYNADTAGADGSGSDETMSVQVIDTAGTQLTSQTVTLTKGSWQTGGSGVSIALPGSGTFAADGVFTIRIRVGAVNGGIIKLGNIQYQYKSQF